MALGTCFYCDQPAVHQCPTCGRAYCDQHGEDVCLRCLAPESATPSVWAFRGSLAAIAAGAAVTLFLLISPPASKSSGQVQRTVTPAPQVGPPTATATPRGTSTSRTPTVAAEPTARPAPSGTPSAAAGRSYTVQPGDTLSGIASRFGISSEAIQAANPGLDPDTIRIGQVLVIPGAQ